MTKTTIMAAIAAMAIGTMAIDTYAVPTYDFTATVKATTGKYSKKTTTYTVNVGKNDFGVFWWEDLGFASPDAAKKYVKGLSNDEKEAFAYDELGFDGQVTKYNVKDEYKRSLIWCYTFKFKVTDESCYRTAKTYKMTATVVIDDCCNDSSGWKFTDVSFDENSDWLASQNINVLFLSKFGSGIDKSADKVEFVASIGDFSAVDAGNWSLAGQGNWNTKNGIVNDISGNIVGFLPSPACESCCNNELPAKHFVCDGDGNIVEVAYENPTPAFGTWSLKYNAKKSK